MKTNIAFLCGGAVTATLLMTGCGMHFPGQSSSGSSGSPAVTTVSKSPTIQTTSPGVSAALASSSGSAPSTSSNGNFVRAVAAKLEPAVVTVHTQSTVEQPMSLQDQMFGGQGGGGAQMRIGAGSGVIISPDGYILTNNHVVAGADQMTVQIGDKGYDARVIGADPLTDIAVVKATVPAGTTLPVAQLGDSDTVQVGDWAIAVGDPLDIGTTVTLGIISAIGARGPQLEGGTNSTVLQTDAAINPGNSGGALANSDGQVIGINEAIKSPTGTSVGIGFAIPINVAQKIAKQLIANGHVIRPYLGIRYGSIQTLPPQVREHFGIDPDLNSGVVIGQVIPGTPASDAGLQPGDLILSADGQTLTDQTLLGKITDSHQVGDTINLQVQRGKQTMKIAVTLRERPASYGLPQSVNGEQP